MAPICPPLERGQLRVEENTEPDETRDVPRHLTRPRERSRRGSYPRLDGCLTKTQQIPELEKHRRSKNIFFVFCVCHKGNSGWSASLPAPIRGSAFSIFGPSSDPPPVLAGVAGSPLAVPPLAVLFNFAASRGRAWILYRAPSVRCDPSLKCLN